MPVKATGWPSISRVFAPILRWLLPADHGLWTSALRVGCKPEAVELAIERGAADLQPPGHLGHLSAVMGDGEANDLALDLLQGADVAGGIDESKPAMRRAPVRLGGHRFRRGRCSKSGCFEVWHVLPRCGKRLDGK